MDDYELLAEDLEEVNIEEYNPEAWSPESAEVSDRIDAEVEKARREAKQTGAEFYNGPLVRLTDFNVEEAALNADLQDTDYFSHIGTRRDPNLSKENRADPLSVGAILHSDDYIVLGERSDLVEIGDGEYQLPGAGFIEDPKTQYERSLNAHPSSPIHRELEEEVNLDPDQMTMPAPEALVGAAHRQPMLIYDVNTVLTPEEVAEEWSDITEEEREFSELIFIPEDDIEEALEGETTIKASKNGELNEERYNGELRPHAEGALTLL